MFPANRQNASIVSGKEASGLADYLEANSKLDVIFRASGAPKEPRPCSTIGLVSTPSGVEGQTHGAF
jgi:hypothetical protein